MGAAKSRNILIATAGGLALMLGLTLHTGLFTIEKETPGASVITSTPLAAPAGVAPDGVPQVQPRTVLSFDAGTDETRTQSASAKTPVSPNRPMTADEKRSLEKALKKDDLCEVWRHLFADSSRKASLGFVAELLLRNENQILGYTDEREKEILQLARALAETRHQFMLPMLEAYRSESTDFYRALVVAGLMHAPESNLPTPDLALAESILRELAGRYPENGIHTFALAAVRQRQGQTIPQTRALYLDAARAERVDDFFTNLTRKAMERSFSSSSFFGLGVFVTAELGMLNWIALTQNTRDYLRSNPNPDPEIARAALAIGRKLMEGAERYDQLQPNVFWHPLHHAIGSRSLARPAWNALHGAAAYPPDLARDYQSFVNEHAFTRQASLIEPLHEFVKKHGRAPAADCPRQGVDQLVRQEFEVFKSLSKVGR